MLPFVLITAPNFLQSRVSTPSLVLSIFNMMAMWRAMVVVTVILLTLLTILSRLVHNLFIQLAWSLWKIMVTLLPVMILLTASSKTSKHALSIALTPKGPVLLDSMIANLVHHVPMMTTTPCWMGVHSMDHQF